MAGRDLRERANRSRVYLASVPVAARRTAACEPSALANEPLARAAVHRPVAVCPHGREPGMAVLGARPDVLEGPVEERQQHPDEPVAAGSVEPACELLLHVAATMRLHPAMIARRRSNALPRGLDGVRPDPRAPRGSC